MEALQNLLMGFAVALTPQNLAFAFLGSVLGTMIGVLPGVGPVAGVAMLIPLTFQMSPTGAIIMLTALFYGTQYGGTITSVLLNVPGEAASAITCLDGYEMAKQGRAGVALSVAAVGSFIGGTIATIALVLAAGPLTRMALEFGPVEFFALITLGLSLLMGLAGKSMIKALMMGVFGLLLAMVGMDPVRGLPRFTFGRMEFMDGIGFVPVIMGLFGLAEILVNAEGKLAQITLAKMSSLIPSKEEIRRFARTHPARQRHRNPSGAGAGDDRFGLVVSVVHRREKGLQISGAVRHRHDRGGSGTRNRQQRPRQRRPDPAVHPRHPRLAHRRGDHGGLHDARAHPGAVSVQGTRRYRLGGDRQLLRRQRHSPDPQPAPDRHLGQDPEDSLRTPVRGDPRLHDGGRLQRQQQHL